MTNLHTYTRQYTLNEVLKALGLTSYSKINNNSPRVGVGFLKYRDSFDKSNHQLSFSLSDVNGYKLIKDAIYKDILIYALGIDSKAQIKNFSSYISILLSHEETLEYNTRRIFKFLKNREKRYEKLMNYIEPIKRMTGGEFKNAKLNLRLNSLKEIPKANKLQYNRLLDDIIENLKRYK